MAAGGDIKLTDIGGTIDCIKGPTVG
jgi:hypothetical protein